MDYKKIGFKAGLEIHQQLDTHKLFCNCSSEITEDIDYSFKRLLRPTQSEMGDVDKAALAEAKKNRFFLYTASSNSTCLVEADEEPPHDVNSEAADICLILSVLLNAKIVDEIHFMRKIVIDGSNTSGFQRTGLISMEGKLDDVGIQTIALEEDSARKIEEKGKLVNYGLDRLGIPLIEIATDPDIKNPEHARKTAEKIGMLLKATGKVKKGLGTIRQDLNVSIREGKRVEIKGIQSLSSISRVAEKEATRQKGIVEIKKTLEKRIKREDLDNIKVKDLTDLFKDTSSKIIKKNLEKKAKIKGFKIPGFKDLLKEKDTRLGKEFAVYARVATGIRGIMHSDELPGYGITEEEVEKIKDFFDITNNDAFIFAVGKEKIVENALYTVIERAKLCFSGVPKEVRRALSDDSTEFMRPMPGAARMYPETDVEPTRITKAYIEKIKNNLPELPEEKEKRFKKEYNLKKEHIEQILNSGYEKEFEELVKKYPDQKKIILRILLNTFSELENEEIDITYFDTKILSDILKNLEKNRFSKEGIPKILRYIGKNREKDVDKAITECNIEKTDEEEIKKLAQRIVKERIDFVKERKLGALGPLMGVIMKELRGKADGKVISRVLKEEIEKII